MRIITPRKNNKGNHNKKHHNNIDDQQELTIGKNKPTGEEQQEGKNNKKAKSNNRRKRIRKNKNLTIVTCNANGIKGKINSLESMLQATKAHIALITETKLPEKQKINIKGYKWIEKKQNRRRRRHPCSTGYIKTRHRRQHKRRHRRSGNTMDTIRMQTTKHQYRILLRTPRKWKNRKSKRNIRNSRPPN